MKKISISEFITLSAHHLVFDVRSPEEYTHAHYPGAVSLPLFSDEERKVVGTAYKKQSKEMAIKLGLDFFGIKMRNMVEEVEKLCNRIQPNDKKILVHCWRGGMRSAGVSWLLELYGYEVYIISGGYKSFRNWVLQQLTLSYKINVLGGYTGSAKTAVLKSIQAAQKNIIDLEAIANHKGSAFGGIGQQPQPTQEMFENKLAIELSNTTRTGIDTSFWIEDESQRIGSINIPHSFWNTMRASTLHFINIPFEERLNYIIKEYGELDKQSLIDATLRIQKRLGPNETKTTIQFIKDNNIREAFIILLQYYDKTYLQALNKRVEAGQKIENHSATNIDVEGNAKTLQLI
jgi:tRNA 2-selenouridine synthase